jgi:hypothetical protein
MSLLTFLSRVDGPIWFDFHFRLRAFDARREAGGCGATVHYWTACKMEWF